jgi:glutamate-5-semialdehyde dehydrogenase
MNAIESEIESIAKTAREAGRALAKASTEQKNRALKAMADALRKDQTNIVAENAKDLEDGEAQGLSKAMLDRLLLDASRLEAVAKAVEEVAALPDPVGKVVEDHTRPNGLRIQKVRVPLGVVAIIYESRPNVTVDAAALCLKAGNAVILRGGSEALRSNIALGKAVQAGLKAAGLPEAAAQVIGTRDRAAVQALFKRDKEVDVLIPRGGRELIDFVVRESRIPVIRHDIGNCHVYVDAAADLKMAEDIAYNAKVQRPSVCNAMEHLIVHQAVAPKFLPAVAKRLEAAGVDLRGDEAARKLAPELKAATAEEWAEEYLDLICGIKVVDSLDAAINHINRYGSQHSDSIITADAAAAERFLKEVDSAAVYWNASTRFTDGGQFGLGAEIGISTQKLHARGPMALEELTSEKYVVRGSGQVRGE